MIDLKGYKGFALLGTDSSMEAARLRIYCLMKNIPLLLVTNKIKYDITYVPCGNVDWIESLLEYNPIPDYYPQWAEHILYRKVWKKDEWIRGRKLFVKPADSYKRFTGFVTHGTWAKKKKNPLIWSEIISFKNEWRYYVSQGIVMSSEWYWGETREPDAPKLYDSILKIPSTYSGALDLGDYNGKLTLIESHHPYACGWYGNIENDSIYFQWIIYGWMYMQKEKYNEI